MSSANRKIPVVAAVAVMSSLLVASIVVADAEISPQFESYAVEFKPQPNRPATVVLSSHPMANRFRTKLRKGAAMGANFAGHFAVVSWGCGNECQGTLVVDVKAGQVLGVVGNSDVLTSANGVEFRPDSRLLIVDPPCPENNRSCLSLGNSSIPVRYYLLEKKGLRFLCSASRDKEGSGAKRAIQTCAPKS